MNSCVECVGILNMNSTNLQMACIVIFTCYLSCIKIGPLTHNNVMTYASLYTGQ